jgi:hypothetical protein
VQNWYAPSLTAVDESSVADWELRDVVAMLKTGVSARGAVLGPMSEVVLNSTQYLSEADLAAMTAYLKRSGRPAPRAAASARAPRHRCAGARRPPVRDPLRRLPRRARRGRPPAPIRRSPAAAR